jgi:hypothetical protein
MGYQGRYRRGIIVENYCYVWRPLLGNKSYYEHNKHKRPYYKVSSARRVPPLEFY